MSEEVFIAGIIALVPIAYGASYMLISLMGRSHYRGDLVREARLSPRGFEVIERREFPALTEEFFRGIKR